MKIDPPEHLSPQARELWQKITDGYSIDPPAAMVLEVTLAAFDRREQARQTIAADGAYVLDRFQQKKLHPAVQVERDAGLTLMRGFRILGFDLSNDGRLEDAAD
jgi:P27 family predicted phage terminase small subunit